MIPPLNSMVKIMNHIYESRKRNSEAWRESGYAIKTVIRKLIIPPTNTPFNGYEE